jgi:hypothetical protein
MKSLTDEAGYWWIPEDPTQRYPGRLSYDPKDGARLELLIEKDTPSFTPAIEAYPLVHGVTNSGRDITLINCYTINDRWSHVGITTQTIFGHLALDGFHLPSAENANIRSISATVPFLSSWLGTTGIDITHDKDLKDFDIAYRQLPPLIARIASSMELKVSVLPASIPIAGVFGEGVTIRENIWLSLKPEQPQPYSDLLNALHVAFDFFTFACMGLCSAEDIQFEADFHPRTLTNGAMVYPRAHFHYMPVYSPKKQKTPHPMDVLLKHSDLSNQFEPFLARWFGISAELKSVRVLYLSALYGDHPYVENRFLSMGQAAEVFHRHFRLGEYMDSERYDNEVLPLMIDRIPTDLPGDLAEVMEQRFEYLNEYSLGKRLKELAAENKEIIVEFVPDIKDVLRAIVEARNQFTHFSPKHERTAISGETILYYTHVLRMIVELSVLREVGIPSELLRKAAISSELYRRMFRSRSH